MLSKIFSVFAGSHYKRFYRSVRPIVAKINSIEEEYQSLSDDQLKAKTNEFMLRYEKGESLDKLLPEAFAAVKNAARRLCGTTVIVCDHEIKWEMIHYDVQLIGGIALHQGMIAEMATGEGKTLVSTLALYLNALSGKNCHLVTVNEYLAKRDSQWMGYVFNFLGLSVGNIYNMQAPDEKKLAYQKNITYGTASEFGFDYLRDNGMSSNAQDQVQTDHFFAIVDEVDSILIDEARTPLIISGPSADSNEEPYIAYRPGIERLAKVQMSLCNKFISEAKLELAKEKPDEHFVGMRFYQTKLGMPKNRILRQLMEEPRNRKILDRFEIEAHSEYNKKKLYQVKETLYYAIDERNNQSDLTELGRNFLKPNDPDAFVLPDLAERYMQIDAMKDKSLEEKQKLKELSEAQFIKQSEQIHAISQLLKAYSLFEKDVEYVVQNGKVHIVDENTGRIMIGRRWSEGLHQAVEAKEGVQIEKETKTYATITIQNYFRLYSKLSGMTGTAETEAQEFFDIYKLKVMAIPTNKPCMRKDLNDIIFKTKKEKYAYTIKEIKKCVEKGEPVLVGTASVDASELLSKMLKMAGVSHNVLNAKNHAMEAQIVSGAGKKAAVTIATNMAGRGTDIKLDSGVNEVGGLFVLATERHESRRIDRQLRGRCARQGDNGTTRFLLSLEDDLMRKFAGDRAIGRLLDKTFKEGEQLTAGILTRSIANVQKQVESMHFSARKRLLQYDDVFNKQREIIYSMRNDCLHSSAREVIFEMILDQIESKLDDVFLNEKSSLPKESFTDFTTWLKSSFPINIEESSFENKSRSEVSTLVFDDIKNTYLQREAFEDKDGLKELETIIVLRALDKNWQDHLTQMDELRRSVGLRGYGQKDPLNEYKSEAYKCFEELIDKIQEQVCKSLFRTATSMEAFESMVKMLQSKLNTVGPKDIDLPSEQNNNQEVEVSKAFANNSNVANSANDKVSNVQLPKVQPVKRELPKLGRNDIVKITKQGQILEIKYKKAQSMIEDEGWTLVDKSK